MKKIIHIGMTVLIAIGLIMLLGCDGDNGSESNEGSLVGTWEAVKEIISIPGTGDATLTPQSEMFMHLIVSIAENNTFTYETWSGSDKTAETAGYESGSGSWEVDGSVFSMEFEGDTQMILEGTYKVSKNKLEISTSLVVDIFGTDPVPVEITMDRIAE
ncbi:hypothetical protein JW835_03905 [bacterium]|nr:hypothetical protein [bacterium]RQV97940.1 MAG: hypothetical protein EH221_03005 [bacterium]